MAEQLTKEERERAWWDAWWREDFSWDGLANKEWEGWIVSADGQIAEKPEGALPDGARDATLQDYWRDQEGDLIVSPNGSVRFTRVHLPLHWRDGAPTGKADWDDAALDPFLSLKLEAAGETKSSGHLYFPRVLGVDRRAQLQGAIQLRNADNYENKGTGLSASFEYAAFVRAAYYAHATFSSLTSFHHAAFFGIAIFDGAAFSGEAIFRSSCFFGGAHFDEVSFSGNAEFGDVTIDDAAFFERTNFSRDASFDGATLPSFCVFDDASFAGDASFSSARFTGHARFKGAKFAGWAIFSDATFSSVVRFDNAVFEKMADFSGVLNEGATQFEGALFLGRMEFEKARFLRIADFSEVRVPKAELNWRGAFDGALFESSLDARGIDLKAVSMFSGVTFDRGVMIRRVGENEQVAAHREALKLAKQAKGDQREAALRALQDGALKLKLAMQQQSDTEREQRYFRLELQARRKQKDTHLSERFFSDLYGVIAGYGASIGRPLGWLAFAIVMSAALYWSIENWTVRSPSAAVEAGRFSMSRVFPLGTWDESNEPLRVEVAEKNCTFRERLLASGECRPVWAEAGSLPEGNVWLEVYRTFVAILSTLQTIFAGAIYFLLALAVRRKFQIS